MIGGTSGGQDVGSGVLFGFYTLANIIVLSVYGAATRRRPPEGAADRSAPTLAYARRAGGLVSFITAHFAFPERSGLREPAAVDLFVAGVVLVSS